ncbi:hypothetical protein [Marinifilum fragile]|uniref:hypothetical protein n=1 Tax=Marinifilum fragile TaxID=570161 RepID=UPI002AA787CF|nr:hypothetical protein [Marinifilum fragile]
MNELKKQFELSNDLLKNLDSLAKNIDPSAKCEKVLENVDARCDSGDCWGGSCANNISF